VTQDPRLERCLDALHGLLQRKYAIPLPSRRTSGGDYEVQRAALAMVELVSQFAQAIIDLGRVGHHRYVAACACARSAFEIGATATWLVLPEDPSVRVNRWVDYFRAMDRFWNNLGNELSSVMPELSETALRQAEQYAEHRRVVEVGLPAVRPQPRPNLQQILNELRHPDLYVAYRIMCQMVHGEPESLLITMGNRGSSLMFGSFAEATSWVIPIRMTVWSLTISAPTVLQRVGVASGLCEPIYEQERVCHGYLDILEGKQTMPLHAI